MTKWMKPSRQFTLLQATLFGAYTVTGLGMGTDQLAQFSMKTPGGPH